MHPVRGPECVCHVLLVETDNGLVLVDAGFGIDDCADPKGRVGPVRFITRPVFESTEAPAIQLDRLGFRREDVRHIVLTHLDTDHVGGAADFPKATIHVTSAEAVAAFAAPTRAEKVRYGRQQWVKDRNVVEHDPQGEAWRGFAAAKELADVAPGIVLVSRGGPDACEDDPERHHQGDPSRCRIVMRHIRQRDGQRLFRGDRCALGAKVRLALLWNDLLGAEL